MRNSVIVVHLTIKGCKKGVEDDFKGRKKEMIFVVGDVYHKNHFVASAFKAKLLSRKGYQKVKHIL